MDFTATYEYVVSANRKGLYRIARPLTVVGYVLYVLVLFTIGFATSILAPMLAIVPLTTWILVWFTWRYVSVEYEYSMTSGVMTLSRIYGGRTRRVLGEVTIKNAVAIAPFEGEHVKRAEQYRPERTVDLTSDLQRPNVYFMLYETADARRGILYFEATEKAVRILKYYNHETVLSELPN